MEIENINNRPSNPEEVSVKELFIKIGEWYRYLLSRWVVILFCALLGSLIGYFYAFYKKPTYTATTTFVLEISDGGGGMGQYAGLASMVGIDIGGGAGSGLFQGDNIIELYKSRTMIKNTLLSEMIYNDGGKHLLIDRYIEFKELNKQWKDKPELLNINFSKAIKSNQTARLKDSLINAFVNDINKNILSVSKLDKKLNIIKVEVKANDEPFAKAFNDQIVKNVNDFYVQTKTKRSQENISILQQKTDSVKAIMNGAIYSAVAIADATPNLNPTRQIQRVAPAQRSQFNAEINKAVLGELVKNLEMSKMALLRETPLIQVVDSPIFPLVKDKLSKAKSIVVGGLILAFFSVLILIIKRIGKQILT